MTRRECLDKAAECVLQDRASQYGGPEDNFGRIAKLWSTYTGTVLDGIDVAMMMALLKVARIRNNKDYSDGYIDLAGYAACGAELAGAEKAREDATRKWGDEYRRLRAKAEGNAKAEDCEEPEFKHGDELELWEKARDRWVPCVYLRKAVDPGYSIVQSSDCRELLVSSFYLRKAEANHPENPDSSQRAEGCEDLVQKNAPQTPRELYDRIIANNPATFKVCTPTGEELAELAEEEKHG